jgi:hypothetical protein
MMAHQTTSVETLSGYISEEVVKALGLSSEWSRRLLKPLYGTAARRFAVHGARFDELVARSGLADAARRFLPKMVNGYEAYGAESIPLEGPLLITSNHPGTYDTLVIAANLARDDIKIVSSDIPFIRGLPATKEYMIFTTRDTHDRMVVLRSAIRHLQTGGTVLIFPSGNIDPDPEILPGAHDHLEAWSPSVELMLRRVPQTQVLVTIVSGVLARACVRSPLTRLRKTARDRQRVAEFIQVIQQMLVGSKFSLVPKVSFAEPATITDLRARSSRAIEALIDRAHHLLADHVTLNPPRLERGLL